MKSYPIFSADDTSNQLTHNGVGVVVGSVTWVEPQDNAVAYGSTGRNWEPSFQCATS